MKAILRVALLALLTGAPVVTTAMADDAANAALARKFYEAINSRNLDALDAIVLKDFMDHMADPQQAHGVDGLKQSLAPFLASSSDLKFVNDPVIAKGEFVTVVDTISGTNDGEIMGMQPTKKSFEFSAIDIWRVKDGKLAEAWHVEQMLQMMMQIGVIGQK
jgi:predicted ester cyclase